MTRYIAIVLMVMLTALTLAGIVLSLVNALR